MLQAVDAISEGAKGSRLSAAFMKKVKPYSEVISENIGTTNTQSVMMSLFIQHAFDNGISLNDVFTDTGCSTSRKLELMNDVDWLVENNYLHIFNGNWGERVYRISNDVVKSFQHNSVFKPKSYKSVNARTLLYTLEDLFVEREDDMSYDQLVTEIRKLFDANATLAFVRNIRHFKLKEEDELLLILFCHLYVNNNDDNVEWHDIHFLYSSDYTLRSQQSELYSGEHTLFKAGLIENTNEGGFLSKESFRLTDKAKEAFLGDLNLNAAKGFSGEFISHTSITQKKLFFPTVMLSQIQALSKMLQEKNYKEICDRMKEKNFHSGLTCLFYGSPGTGKTEVVLQLARESSRDIMRVDLSDIRSMFVGNTERNVKNIFNRYNSLKRNSKLVPILLFNESDAIINSRTTSHDSAVDRMENSVQNILLQEMETFDGILIATTNLHENMDKAFERRFLYKVHFEKPDIASKAKIWHTFIPELSEDETRQLAKKYNFSGGQIENVARRYAIEYILNGKQKVSYKILDDFCKQESILKHETGNIGFKM